MFSFQPVFLRFDLSADFGYHFFEELFTFLARFGVDGMDFALAVSVGRRIPPFKQGIAYLINPAGACLADFAFIRLEIRRTRRVYGFFGYFFVIVLTVLKRLVFGEVLVDFVG